MWEIVTSNVSIGEKIELKKEEIEYKTSKPYKNKILKSEQWLKSKWEKVLYITSEADFNKFTKPYESNYQDIDQEAINDELEWLTNIEKWKIFLFGEWV